ncbi:MAG: hypothetical protein M1825_004538 [Sarcosagium campestre]|nr:MAG: hypothetical protein M1825_004538 [Sarcosagium campestre]
MMGQLVRRNPGRFIDSAGKDIPVAEDLIRAWVLLRFFCKARTPSRHTDKARVRGDPTDLECVRENAAMNCNRCRAQKSDCIKIPRSRRTIVLNLEVKYNDLLKARRKGRGDAILKAKHDETVAVLKAFQAQIAKESRLKTQKKKASRDKVDLATIDLARCAKYFLRFYCQHTGVPVPEFARSEHNDSDDEGVAVARYSASADHFSPSDHEPSSSSSSSSDSDQLSAAATAEPESSPARPERPAKHQYQALIDERRTVAVESSDAEEEAPAPRRVKRTEKSKKKTKRTKNIVNIYRHAAGDLRSCRPSRRDTPKRPGLHQGDLVREGDAEGCVPEEARPAAEGVLQLSFPPHRRLSQLLRDVVRDSRVAANALSLYNLEEAVSQMPRVDRLPGMGGVRFVTLHPATYQMFLPFVQGSRRSLAFEKARSLQNYGTMTAENEVEMSRFLTIEAIDLTVSRDSAPRAPSHKSTPRPQRQNQRILPAASPTLRANADQHRDIANRKGEKAKPPPRPDWSTDPGICPLRERRFRR